MYEHVVIYQKSAFKYYVRSLTQLQINGTYVITCVALLTKNPSHSTWPYIVKLLYGRKRLILCRSESTAKKHVWLVVNNEQTEGLIRSNRQTQKTPAALKPFFS